MYKAWVCVVTAHICRMGLEPMNLCIFWFCLGLAVGMWPVKKKFHFHSRSQVYVIQKQHSCHSGWEKVTVISLFWENFWEQTASALGRKGFDSLTDFTLPSLLIRKSTALTSGHWAVNHDFTSFLFFHRKRKREQKLSMKSASKNNHFCEQRNWVQLSQTEELILLLLVVKGVSKTYFSMCSTNVHLFFFLVGVPYKNIDDQEKERVTSMWCELVQPVNSLPEYNICYILQIQANSTSPKRSETL